MILGIIQFLVMGWAGMLVRSMGIDRTNAERAVTQLRAEVHDRMAVSEALARFAALEHTVADVRRLIEDGNERSSRLASTVNGLPDKLASRYVEIGRAEALWAQSKTDRERLWTAIDDLRKDLGRRTR